MSEIMSETKLTNHQQNILNLVKSITPSVGRQKNNDVAVKVKKSKVFEVGGFTFAISRLLRIDYQ